MRPPPPVHSQFKKGSSGNPGGVPRIPDGLRHIARLSQIEVSALVSKYARMTKMELSEAIRSDSIAMIDMTIATIFASAAKNGDYQRLAFLLDRAVGKVVHVEIPDEDQESLRALTNEELVAKARALIPKLVEEAS